jgi:methylenetetrahydrofolate reductase (NADPH)
VENRNIDKNLFKESLLNPDVFCVTWEQVPGRSLSGKQGEVTHDNIVRAAEGEKIHAISITDNPNGSPACSSSILGTEIKRMGIEPLVHLALRDKNRNEIESLLYGLSSQNVRNLLVMSGDYPSSRGFQGRAKPVFDLDPVHVMQLISQMNHGLRDEDMIKPVHLAPTDIFAGVVVSPFKTLESELMCQYYKLHKKLMGGAQFIVSQVGYDARKMHELLLWLKQSGYHVPAMVNIYVLNYQMAKLMHDNQIPGCGVTDSLLGQLEAEKQAADKGKGARLLRAAKMFAVARGLGYAGAHIGGPGLNYESVEYIIDRGNELYQQWDSLLPEFNYPQRNAFYYFNLDKITGLNTNEAAPKLAKSRRSFIAGFSRAMHHIFFNPGNAFFGLFQKISHSIDNSKALKKLFGFFEYQGKKIFFRCQDCGDCALMDTAYICPMSQCPKHQRLGPCGGSRDGWCEVFPGERLCIWVRAYDRMKVYHEEDSLGEYIIPPQNWELWQTSSWLNFYMGRDHTSRRFGVNPPFKTN